jgi:hypothetical protein
VSSAKPGSLRQRADRIKALGVWVLMSSSLTPAGFRRDMSAEACTLVPGVSQQGQARHERPEDAQDVLAGGSLTVGPMRVTMVSGLENLE